MIKSKSDKYITMSKEKAGIEANKVVDKFRSKYALKPTLSENAEELVDEGYFGNIPEGALSNYIDFEAIGRDLECDYAEVNGDLFYSQY